MLKKEIWAIGVDQVLKHLLSKCEALSSNPNATKKKEEEILIPR
jgi:hypothetical protein